MTSTDSRTFVLWGFHPRYSGPAGVVPIKLTSGTLEQCRAGQKLRAFEPGWTFGTYLQFDEPTGLRLQCREAHGTPDDLNGVDPYADEVYECPDCGEGHDGMTTGTEYCPGCTE